MKNQFTVKEKSIITFLETKLIDPPKFDRNRSPLDFSPPRYNFKGDLFLKKDCGLEIGQEIIIHITDRAETTDTVIAVAYHYEVKEYDDISLLMEFKTTNKAILS